MPGSPCRQSDCLWQIPVCLHPQRAENQQRDNRIFPSRGRGPGPVSSQCRAEPCVRCEHRLCRSSQRSVCHRIPALAAVGTSSSRSCKLPGSYTHAAWQEILPVAAAGRWRQTEPPAPSGNVSGKPLRAPGSCLQETSADPSNTWR